MRRQQPVLSARANSRGFTLVEMAVVVAIIALMISGLMVPAAVMLDQRKYSETADLLASANDAIVGWAALNGRLPCPDRNGDGVEDCPTNQDANHAWGNLPFTTLSVVGFDAWGNRLRYSVVPQATTVPNRFSAVVDTLPGLIVTCSSATLAAGMAGHLPGCHNAVSGAPIQLASQAIFLVMSFGKNSWGAVSGGGTTFPAPTSFDELNNIVAGGTAATRRTFVSRMRTDIGTPAGEFDDVLIWMSAGQFIARMEKAGLWPPTATP